MRVPRIFTAQPLARVLRMREKDPLTLFNGEGGQFLSHIVSIEKKRVIVKLGACSAKDLESPLQVHLGIALSRGERMDWIIQKATELGVYSISPVFSERSNVRLKDDRLEKKLSHWRQVAISACEQCGRNSVPQLDTALELTHWQQSVQADRRLVLHHRSSPASGPSNTPGSVALLIGPEGGLSEAEISAAEASGFEALSLGPRILRTETAPLAALAIIQAQWGDMPLLR